MNKKNVIPSITFFPVTGFTYTTNDEDPSSQ